MNNSELVQIADILPPTAPVISSVDFWICCLLLATGILLATIWYRRTNKQRLRKLRGQFRRHRIDSRQCAFELSCLTRHNRQMTIKYADSLSQVVSNPAWQSYLTTLQTACYSRHGLSNDDMQQLIDETKRWI